MNRSKRKFWRWPAIFASVLVAALTGTVLMILYGAKAPTLEFSHYERAGFGDEAVAVLKFTNTKTYSVVFDMWISSLGTSPTYRLETKDGGKWIEAEEAGFPRKFSTVAGKTMGEVLPGETVILKLAIPSYGTPCRIGFRYRPWEPRTFRSAVFRLRGYLCEMGWGGTPDYVASMETVWCDKILSAPKNIAGYQPRTAAPTYRFFNSTGPPKTLRQMVGLGPSKVTVSTNSGPGVYSLVTAPTNPGTGQPLSQESHPPPSTQHISASMSFDLPSSSPTARWEGK